LDKNKEPTHSCTIAQKGYVNWIAASAFISKNDMPAAKSCSYQQNDLKFEGHNILKSKPLKL